jgi:hypothetical protein
MIATGVRQLDTLAGPYAPSLQPVFTSQALVPCCFILAASSSAYFVLDATQETGRQNKMKGC